MCNEVHQSMNIFRFTVMGTFFFFFSFHFAFIITYSSLNFNCLSIFFFSLLPFVLLLLHVY